MSIHKDIQRGWFVAYRDETGQQRRKRFGKGRAAKKLAEAFDHQVKADKLQQKPLARPSGSPLYMDELVQLYLDHLKAEGKSDSYRKELLGLFSNHLLPLLCGKTVDKLRYQDMTAVVDYYTNRPNPAHRHTINRYLRYCRTIFRFGIDHGHTMNNPLAKWKTPSEPKKPVQLTVDGLRKLIDHASPHLAWGLEVAFNLGARPGESELLALRYEHVDYDAGSVHIFAPKTRTWRIVPISDAFLAKLRWMEGQAQSGHIIEYQGKPIRKFRRAFDTARTRAALPYHVTMHDVRHLFASVLLAGGADLAAVSNLLGHARISTTQERYYHLLDGEKRRAVSLLPRLRIDSEEEGKVVPIWGS